MARIDTLNQQRKKAAQAPLVKRPGVQIQSGVNAPSGYKAPISPLATNARATNRAASMQQAAYQKNLAYKQDNAILEQANGGAVKGFGNLYSQHLANQNKEIGDIEAKQQGGTATADDLARLNDLYSQREGTSALLGAQYGLHGQTYITASARAKQAEQQVDDYYDEQIKQGNSVDPFMRQQAKLLARQNALLEHQMEEQRMFSEGQQVAGRDAAMGASDASGKPMQTNTRLPFGNRTSDVGRAANASGLTPEQWHAQHPLQQSQGGMPSQSGSMQDGTQSTYNGMGPQTQNQWMQSMGFGQSGTGSTGTPGAPGSGMTQGMPGQGIPGLTPEQNQQFMQTQQNGNLDQAAVQTFIDAIPDTMPYLKQAMLNLQGVIGQSNMNSASLYLQGMGNAQASAEDMDAIVKKMEARVDKTAQATTTFLDKIFDNQKLLAEKQRDAELAENKRLQQEYEFQTNKAVRDMERSKAKQLSSMTAALALTGQTYSSPGITMLVNAERESDIAINDLKEAAAIHGTIFAEQALKIDANYTQTVNNAYQSNAVGTLQALQQYNDGLDKAASLAFTSKKEKKAEEQRLLEALQKSWDGNSKDLAKGLFDAAQEVRVMQQTEMNKMFEKQNKDLSLLQTIWQNTGGYATPEGKAAMDNIFSSTMLPQNYINAFKSTNFTVNQQVSTRSMAIQQQANPANYTVPEQRNVMTMANLLAPRVGSPQDSTNFLDQTMGILRSQGIEAADQYVITQAYNALQGPEKTNVNAMMDTDALAGQLLSFMDANKSALGAGFLTKNVQNAIGYLQQSKNPAYQDFAATLQRMTASEFHARYGSALTESERKQAADLPNLNDTIQNVIRKTNLISKYNRQFIHDHITRGLGALPSYLYSSSSYPSPGTSSGNGATVNGLNYDSYRKAFGLPPAPIPGKGGGNLASDPVVGNDFGSYERNFSSVSQDFTGTYSTSRGYFTDGRKTHEAYDLTGYEGKPIPAFRGGIVADVIYSDKGYGNHVIVDLPGGYKVIYAHLKDINVSAGQQLSAAQVLGSMGRSGQADGVHLHFEVRGPDGRPVDPSLLFGNPQFASL